MFLPDGPTPAFSGAAGDLHRTRRATVRHRASRSRPAHGPRQRRPLQSVVGHSSLKRYINNTSQIVSFCPFFCHIFYTFIIWFFATFFYLFVQPLYLCWVLGFLTGYFLSSCKTFTPRLGSRLSDGLFYIFLYNLYTSVGFSAF